MWRIVSLSGICGLIRNLFRRVRTCTYLLRNASVKKNLMHPISLPKNSFLMFTSFLIPPKSGRDNFLLLGKIWIFNGAEHSPRTTNPKRNIIIFGNDRYSETFFSLAVRFICFYRKMQILEIIQHHHYKFYVRYKLSGSVTLPFYSDLRVSIRIIS